jgi:hypothetical protein
LVIEIKAEHRDVLSQSLRGKELASGSRFLTVCYFSHWESPFAFRECRTAPAAETLGRSRAAKQNHAGDPTQFHPVSQGASSIT